MSETLNLMYVWQSDTPGSVNRNFLKDVLERVAKKINHETGLVIEVDYDTRNVPGLCDIPATILEKIDRATAVVADLTFVAATTEGKHCPNPNVLIELGYALRSKGYSGVDAVINEAFGPVGKMCFDIQHRRYPATYTLREGDSKPPVRDALVSQLCARLKPMFEAASHSTEEDGANLFNDELTSISDNLDELCGNHPNWQHAFQVVAHPLRHRQLWNNRDDLYKVVNHLRQQRWGLSHVIQTEYSKPLNVGLVAVRSEFAWGLTKSGLLMLRQPLDPHFVNPTSPPGAYSLARTKPLIELNQLFLGVVDALSVAAALCGYFDPEEMVTVSMTARGLKGQCITINKDLGYVTEECHENEVGDSHTMQAEAGIPELLDFGAGVLEQMMDLFPTETGERLPKDQILARLTNFLNQEN